ncbi:unnamed protein product [Absidia cylindrospora]
MHSVSPMDNLPLGKEANGYEKQSNEIDNNNGLTFIDEKKEQQKHIQQTTYTNGDSNHSKEKIVLPVEMASMVPLRTLVGKMINKAHADLMTLTDTLPSMSDVERKRQILNYTTFTRTQFLKLMVLVKWAENADDVQMCQNIMAFLANQNKTFQDTVDYLHKIHVELPAARVRNFDILTAVDVLTTGTYQRMPTKIEDMLPPAPLTDQEVLETFTKMNDEIRVRMLTKEILPSTMQKYRIANGRVYFCVNNEFDVSLTLMGNSDDRKWWIVSLDVLVQPSPGGSASDVDISLNDVQRQRLRASAQRQLAPPEPQNIDNTTNKELPATDANAPSNTISRDTKAPNEQQQPSDRELFFPLVNLYDYLHLFCLNMQLEIVYMQATMMAKTQWLDQLKVHMNSARTSLTLLYWGGGSPTAHWGSPQVLDNSSSQQSQQQPRSTSIEISISNEDTKRTGQTEALNKALSIAVRDEYKGLIQKSGIGASVSLANLDEVNKSKVYNSLKYPKTCLEVLWSGSSDLHTNENLLNSTDMNIEMLLLHITTYHKQSILGKFRQLLNSESAFLEANGLQLVDSLAEDNSTDISSGGQPLVVRYRHDRYIYIDFDSRVGRVKVRETGKHGGDGNAKLGGLEDRLNSDPTNIGRHLLWLRSEVVVHEIVSLAKQLNLQPFHPSQMLLRPDDMLKLFGDLPTTTPDPVELPPSRNRSVAHQQQSMTTSSSASVSSVTSSPSISGKRIGADQVQQQSSKPAYPQHFVFLQFSQFEDWYLVIAVIKNEFQPSLCCLRKINDQNAIYQEFVDLIHVDHEQVWKERFASGRNDVLDLNLGSATKTQQVAGEDLGTHSAKRRRTMTEHDLLSETKRRITEKIDNLSIDLPFLAKLESLSRAFITNRKIELQLHQYRTIRSYTRPFIKSLSGKETRAINHPSADRMEVLCVSQSDLLKTCALRNVDIHTPNPSGAMNATPRMDFFAWVESIAPRMTNEVMLRSSGWWTRGRRQCFVEIQDKVDWGNIPLKSNNVSDHITMDGTNNMLSFVYNDVDSCVDQFLKDWERIFMLANLSRQVSSIWLTKYGDELSFEPCDMRTLTFTYAKDFVCTIRWDSPGKGQARRYMVNFTTSQKHTADLKSSSSTGKNGNTPSDKLYLASAVKRNPHWRVIAFLQDVLNDKRDLIYFVQVLFQTLPLMACLEQLEGDCARSGDVGQVCIIPRASDSVRIMFSSLHGIDIRFQDPSMICISDAAFHHTVYRTLQKTSSTKSIHPPSPYIPPSASSADQGLTEKNTNISSSGITPIKVAQQMICKPFMAFDKVLEDVDQWIFMAPNQQESSSAMEDIITDHNDDEQQQQPWYLSGKYCWVDASEPTVVSFDHGLLCSASLCRNVLFKLQHSCLKNPPVSS